MKRCIFAENNLTMRGNFIQVIRDVAKDTLPDNSKVILFGSRARNDARDDSDWDLLIILDKEKRTTSDIEKYACPFMELGYDVNAEINPIVYTQKEWDNRKFTMFHHNVEREGIEIWH